MTEKNENRRVRMTKRMIKDALLELIEQQPLVNISITAVCDTADVHRSTFYKYYTDIADLLNEIEQDILDQIPVPKQDEDKSQLLKKTTAFFDFVKQSEKTFRILFSESAGSSFITRLVDHLRSGYILLEVDSDTDELTAQFIRHYIANGTVGMLRAWINSDYPVSSHRIAEMMYDMSKKVQS
ncbi:MAG TPA: hypothetical protein DHV42_03340 [Lachnospiraceae bacterium]|nr:hypothetical protein [Lachnospiraceae bacterium]